MAPAVFLSGTMQDIAGSKAMAPADSSSFCLCCNVPLADDPGHYFSHAHFACVGRLLTDAPFCDRMLRDVRPKKSETEIVVSCESGLKQVLKPWELLLIGSSGKRTAIAGSPDLEVAVYMGPQSNAIDLVVERLSASDNLFHVIEKNAESVIAQYSPGKDADLDGMEVTITPTRVPLKKDVQAVGWQLQHRDLFSSKPGWLKDAVRLLKIWVGAKCQMPGVLLETAALQVQEPEKSKVRCVFLWSIEKLAKGDIESWKDPLLVLTPSGGCSEMEVKNNLKQLQALQDYALATLKINDLEREKQCEYGCTWEL